MNKINDNYLTNQSKYNSSAISINSTILWNPNVHYPVDKSPSLVSVKSHINAQHTFQFYNSYFRVIYILPPTLVSEMAPFKFPYQSLYQFIWPQYVPNIPPIYSPFRKQQKSWIPPLCDFLQPLLLPPCDADDNNDDESGPAKWC